MNLPGDTPGLIIMSKSYASCVQLAEMAQSNGIK